LSRHTGESMAKAKGRLLTREMAETLADPTALCGIAEAMESEQAGDVVYGVEAARALLAERKR
jgi:hypothetical protein